MISTKVFCVSEQTPPQVRAEPFGFSAHHGYPQPDRTSTATFGERIAHTFFFSLRFLAESPNPFRCLVSVNPQSLGRPKTNSSVRWRRAFGNATHPQQTLIGVGWVGKRDITGNEQRRVRARGRKTRNGDFPLSVLSLSKHSFSLSLAHSLRVRTTMYLRFSVADKWLIYGTPRAPPSRRLLVLDIAM